MMHDDQDPAATAAMDQQDAAIREAMRLPYGGMFTGGYYDPITLPYLDASGAVGTVTVDRPDTDRPCSACLSGVPANGAPCAGPCGRPADLRARFDHGDPELACRADTADFLASLRGALMDGQHLLG